MLSNLYGGIDAITENFAPGVVDAVEECVGAGKYSRNDAACHIGARSLTDDGDTASICSNSLLGGRLDNVHDTSGFATWTS
jgi:hypothetical protein